MRLKPVTESVTLSIIRLNLQNPTQQMMERLRQRHHILLLVCFCVCFLTGLSADKVEWKQVGEHVEIACSTRLQNQGGMYLYHTYHKTREVFYLTPGMKCTPKLPFGNRIKVRGLFANLHATVSNLTVNDTGVFWCQYVRFDKAKQYPSESNNNPTQQLLVVDGLEKECPTTAPVTEASEEPIQMSTLLLVSAITACSLFLLVLIILLICVKRCCAESGKFKPRPQSDSGLPAHRSDSVYEQMRPQRATSHSSGRVLLNPAYMHSPNYA
ncbi:uncharacterized protein LOC134094222 [Sardina pilchardus]|uniref:uncharacterized protein LOC134094222 n=1 Tax=Sardina pilchardus TaxID=27697 RepID=UPI002E10FDAD